jgi:hypothetical protein
MDELFEITVFGDLQGSPYFDPSKQQRTLQLIAKVWQKRLELKSGLESLSGSRAQRHEVLLRDVMGAIPHL